MVLALKLSFGSFFYFLEFNSNHLQITVILKTYSSRGRTFAVVWSNPMGESPNKQLFFFCKKKLH
jgi:hypothetical protein